MVSVKEFSLRKPFITSILLLSIALGFRLVDIFVLRLDERLGEIILSKALGFGLVVAFLWAIGKRMSAIGFHASRLGRSLAVALIITTLPLAAGYAIEIFYTWQFNQGPHLLLAAIDPKAGVTGGLLFGLWLVLGNLVNSLMEEGLFRGIMLNLYRPRLSPWDANLLQAALFGAWHLVWVAKAIQTGAASTPIEIGVSIVSNFLPQFLMGLVWGYLYLMTGSLWASFLAHTLTNTTLNLLHIVTRDGIDSGITFRVAAFSILSLFVLFLVPFLSQRLKIPAMPVWDRPETRSPQLD